MGLPSPLSLLPLPQELLPPATGHREVLEILLWAGLSAKHPFDEAAVSVAGPDVGSCS